MVKRTSLVYFLIGLVLCVLAGQGMAADANPRLALCASGDKKAGDVVELMTVSLSKDDKVVLLDRANIVKVLDEHKLALTGMLSTDDALKAGQLLNCDVFAELNYRAGDDALACLVMFDAATGVRLCDQSFPANTTIEKLSETMAGVLRGGLDKWRGNASGSLTRTISLIGVRGMDLHYPAEDIPNVIGILLERELLRSAGVTVLERKRLDLINKERQLTDVARDRLLASTVRLDIDVLRYKSDTNVEVWVTLSDVSGKTIGAVQHVGAADNVGAIVTALTAGILARLNVAPVGTAGLSCHDEAFRFFSDMKVLELRGEKQNAAVAEDAALALAETALAQMPNDVKIQHLVVHLERRKAQTVTDPWQLVDMLERDISLCEKWPAEKDSFANGYFFDTRTHIGGFAALLKKALGELEALPGQKNEAAPRLVRLRERFGVWVKAMLKRNWRYSVYLVNIELYSHNVDEVLDEADHLLTFVPPELILDLTFVLPETRLDDFSQNWTNPKRLLSPINTYTDAQKRRLFGLYQKWDQMGDDRDRFRSSLSAAILVNTFPDVFENPTAKIDEELQKAADIATSDFCGITGLFLKFMRDQACAKWHPSWKAFANDSAIKAARVMMEKQSSHGIMVPDLYVYLDEIGASVAAEPGEFLATARNILMTGRHVSGAAEPPVEPDLARIGRLYYERYGRRFPAQEEALAKAAAGNLAMVTEWVPLFKAQEQNTKVLAAAWSGYEAWLLVNGTNATYEMWQVDVPSGKAVMIGRLKTRSLFMGKTEVRCEGMIEGLGSRVNGPLSFFLPVDAQISVGRTTVTVPGSSGLMVFSRTGQQPKVISLKNGLPAETVLSCCEAGGMLYIGCKGDKEGYVVKCRPDGSALKVLACSGRHEKHSDLDDCIPYVVESIVEDPARNRLFIVASIPLIKWTGWLYSLNLENDQIQSVCSDWSFLRQLRAAGKDSYIVRIHSNNGIVNNVAGFSGYGLWDSSDYQDTPISSRKFAVKTVMGNGVRDMLNWTGGQPNFTINECVLPSSTAAMAFFDEKHLVASDEAKWQLLTRSDAGGTKQDLPLLEGTAPFAVNVFDGTLMACNHAGLWRVGLKLLEPAAAAKKNIGTSEGTIATNQVPKTTPPVSVKTGVFVLEAPAGTWVCVDDHTYRVGIKGPLIWNKMSVGAHKVSLSFLGKERHETVTVQEGKMVAIKETFGEDTAKTWVLDLEKNVKMNFAWVPQESHTGGGFWMSKFEVTQEQYERISATNTCPIMRSPSCPATGLKEQVEAFCRKLNQLHPDALKGMAARLPTTAEWIYACKAGSTNTFYSGDTEDDLFVAAWAGDNGQSRLHACGLKMPNAFWLYDMLGSSKEWVSDGQPCGEHLFHNSKLTGYCLEGVGFRIVVAGQSNEKRINDFMDGVSNDKP